jgi:hypothetical protein
VILSIGGGSVDVAAPAPPTVDPRTTTLLMPLLLLLLADSPSGAEGFILGAYPPPMKPAPPYIVLGNDPPTRGG